MVLVLPTIFAFGYSLMELQLARVSGFAGFANWSRVVVVEGSVALILRTLAFVIGTTVLTLAIAFPIALWIDRMTRGLAFVAQIIVILPWVMSHIVASLLFRWTWIESLGLGAWLSETLTGERFSPLLTGTGAMGSIIAVASWRTLGFAVLLLLAGVKSLDADLFEAAKVDGANAFQRFFHLTIPLLRTPLTIVTIVLLMSALNNAEVPLATTGGGPGNATTTLALRIYELAFVHLDFGGSAALASAAMVVNVIFVVVYTRIVGVGEVDR